MRRIGQQWLSAWSDLLFATSSPLRQRLDEPVLLVSGDERRVFQGGVESGQGGVESGTDIAAAACRARQLPDELLLARELTVPLAAESELAAVLQMEVAAGSPFADADTSFGWRERSRDEQGVHLVLAIASRAAVTQWLREQPAENSSAQPGVGAVPVEDWEVWADCNGSLVTLRGFGEARREQLYRKRLGNAAGLCGAAALGLLLIAGLFAMQQRLLTERLETLQAEVQRKSQLASEHRTALADANDTIRAANALIASYPNPHPELARLTELLSDSVFVAHFSMRGREIRIRGRADDAAVVMQTLAEAPGYATVTAPQAITAVGNTGLEQFHLDIELTDPSAAASTRALDTAPDATQGAGN